MTDTPIAKATAAINTDRALELEEANIATVNDRIREHDQAVATNDSLIAACQDRIRAARLDTRTRKAEQARLRRERAIFSRAAFNLRQVREP